MRYAGLFIGIFALLVCFTGFYIYGGGKVSILTGRPSFKNLTDEQWASIGKGTILVGMFLLVVATILFAFPE